MTSNVFLQLNPRPQQKPEHYLQMCTVSNRSTGQNTKKTYQKYYDSCEVRWDFAVKYLVFSSNCEMVFGARIPSYGQISINPITL